MVQFNDAFSGNRAVDMRAQEEERYVQAMAPRIGFPYIYLRGYTINPEALLLLPEQTARTVGAVSFDVKQKVVSLAATLLTQPYSNSLKSSLNESTPLSYIFAQHKV